MKDFDLEKEFAVTKNKPSTEPHPLKQFFADRLISQSMLAEVLDVTKVQISLWLNGCRHFPDKWLSELNEIKDRILKWESEHGHRFNGLSVNKPVCPYDEDNGLKFGADFDEYDVCEDCKMRLACEKEKVKTKPSVKK